MYKGLAALFTVIIIGTVGHVLMKYGFIQNEDYEGATFSIEGIMKIITNPYLMIGILLAGINFILWLVVIRYLELGYAFYMASIEYVLLLFASYWFLKETISLPKVIGVILIIAGVIFINWGEAKELKEESKSSITPVSIND